MHHCRRMFPEQLKTNFQIHLSNDSSPLRYIFEQRYGPCLIMKIPHRVILKWRELMFTITNISFQELLHLSSEHLSFSIKSNTVRIEEGLRTLSSKVYAQNKGLRGLSRINFLNKTKSFQLYQQELVDVSSLKTRVKKCEEEKNDLQRQLKELDSRCEEIFQELLKENNHVNNIETESEKVCQENKELTEYIDILKETMICDNCSLNLKNTGLPLNELS